MFHRQYMHKMLMDSAVSEEGEGIPAKLIVNHRVFNTRYSQLYCTIIAYNLGYRLKRRTLTLVT